MEQQDSYVLTLNLDRFHASGTNVLHIASSVVLTWAEIKQAIAPVIGARGVAALYERSLFLTRGQHPWMVPVPDGVEMEMSLPALEAILIQQDSATAVAGGVAHLQTFHEVLSSLIGPSLSDSLLRSIWEKSTNGPAALDKKSR